MTDHDLNATPGDCVRLCRDWLRLRTITDGDRPVSLKGAGSVKPRERFVCTHSCDRSGVHGARRRGVVGHARPEVDPCSGLGLDADSERRRLYAPDRVGRGCAACSPSSSVDSGSTGGPVAGHPFATAGWHGAVTAAARSGSIRASISPPGWGSSGRRPRGPGCAGSCLPGRGRR